MKMAFLSQRRFDAAKLQKINLFETERFFLDVYCLEPGQAQKAHAHAGSDKVYAVLEDGIPLWLRTEVELIVSGKNREEEIGSILPPRISRAGGCPALQIWISPSFDARPQMSVAY